MATTLFPTDTAQTISVTPDATNWSAATLKKLATARGSGAVTKTVSTSAAVGVVPVASPSSVEIAVTFNNTQVQSGTTPEASVGGSADIIWVSDAIGAVTIAGNITVNMRALESNAMANYACQAHVYKIDGASGVTTCIGRGGNGSELGTSEGPFSITVTPTSTAYANGDYIAVRFFYGAATGTTPASGFTASFFYAGASGATGDTFVTFTETITAATTAVTRTPNVVMAPYTPA